MRSRVRKIAHQFLRDEAGFTLVEALMAVVIGLMIVGIGVTVFTAAGRSQPSQLKRGDAIRDSRNVMERLTREIRQGSTVYPSTDTQLSLVTYVKSASCGGAPGSTSIQCKVTYTCSSGSCTRVEAPPPGNSGSNGPAVTVVSGLSASDIFRYGTSCSSTTTPGAPGYICVTLTFPADNGDDALTLQDGATPMNPSS
jgi:Flp pilus assembly pilin Flp